MGGSVGGRAGSAVTFKKVRRTHYVGTVLAPCALWSELGAQTAGESAMGVEFGARSRAPRRRPGESGSHARRNIAGSLRARLQRRRRRRRRSPPRPRPAARARAARRGNLERRARVALVGADARSGRRRAPRARRRRGCGAGACLGAEHAGPPRVLMTPTEGASVPPPTCSAAKARNEKRRPMPLASAGAEEGRRLPDAAAAALAAQEARKNAERPARRRRRRPSAAAPAPARPRAAVGRRAAATTPRDVAAPLAVQHVAKARAAWRAKAREQSCAEGRVPSRAARLRGPTRRQPLDVAPSSRATKEPARCDAPRQGRAGNCSARARRGSGRAVRAARERRAAAGHVDDDAHRPGRSARRAPGAPRAPRSRSCRRGR